MANLLDVRVNDRVLTGRGEVRGVQEGQIGWARVSSGGAKHEV